MLLLTDKYYSNTSRAISVNTVRQDGEQQEQKGGKKTIKRASEHSEALSEIEIITHFWCPFYDKVCIFLFYLHFTYKCNKSNLPFAMKIIFYQPYKEFSFLLALSVVSLHGQQRKTRLKL